MNFWISFWMLTGIHLLAALSPGPDFVYVSQQTVSYGRRTGLICSVGIALGLAIHLIYSILGMSVLIASATWLITAIKIIGGCYLIYLGVQGLRARAQGSITILSAQEKNISENAKKTLWKGFLCNVLNPKVPIYFVAIFTTVLSPEMPLWQLSVYGIWLIFLQFMCLSLVVLILSIPVVNKYFRKNGHWVNRFFGGVMVLLGIKVIAS